MVCFRLYGHNESDEPAFTQPLMYKAIRSHTSTLEIYAGRLIAEGLLTHDALEGMKGAWVSYLDAELEASKSYRPEVADWLGGRWTGLRFDGDPAGSTPSVPTGVAPDDLVKVGRMLTQVPSGFTAHPTVQPGGRERPAIIANAALELRQRSGRPASVSAALRARVCASHR